MKPVVGLAIKGSLDYVRLPPYSLGMTKFYGPRTWRGNARRKTLTAKVARKSRKAREEKLAISRYS